MQLAIKQSGAEKLHNQQVLGDLKWLVLQIVVM
jgi:hypothetical protein